MRIDRRRNLTTKLAYLAGFFDGEGCVRIKHSNKQGNSYYLTVHVTNTDKSVLDMFQELFEGSIYYQEKGVNKDIYQYYLSSGDAADFLRTIVGFLVSKRKQAELALEFHDKYVSIKPEERERYHDEMRDLKKSVEVIGNIHQNPELIK